MNTSTKSPGAFRLAWATFIARLTPRFVLYAIFVVMVAGVAAYNSWGHQVTVAHWAHQAGVAALTLPLSVDGMLAVASLAMAEDKANGRRPRAWARFAFWLGAVVSVAANLASIFVVWGLDWLSLGLSMWAPIALLVVVEIMARPGKPVVDPADAEKAEKRSTAAKKAAVTRKANASKGTRRTRTPKAPAATPVSPGRVPVEELNADMAA